MARPKGPIRKFKVSCIWPSSPKVWREAVDMVDEGTARQSFEALRGMHYAVEVTIIFLRPNTTRAFMARYTTGRWDRHGRLVYQHTGEMIEYMPAWALGRQEKEEAGVGTGGTEADRS